MGLFDRFRKPKAPLPGPPSAPRRFVGDRARMFSLDHTRRLEALFGAPPAGRDATWIEAFYDAAWYASIAIPEPVHFDGPDGFPYYRLDIPRAKTAFDSQSLGNVALDCVERNAGAAVFASPDDPVEAPQFVLSMGLLDSLLRYDSPLGDPIDLSESGVGHDSALFEAGSAGLRYQVLAVKASHDILTGMPSAEFLPPYAARGLHRYMTRIWGIENPRVLLMVDHALRPSRNLVIGRKRSSFTSDAEVGDEMRRLSWFLPPHRATTLMPEDWSLEQMGQLADLGRRAGQDD